MQFGMCSCKICYQTRKCTTKEGFVSFYHIGLMNAPLYLGDGLIVFGVSILTFMFGIAIFERFYRLQDHDRVL